MTAESSAECQRLDKWLFQARFFKTRSLAAKLVAARKVRVNREVVTKAHHRLRPGDVLTFPQGREVRVIRVLGFADKRGPASVARTLYAEMAEPALG